MGNATETGTAGGSLPFRSLVGHGNGDVFGLHPAVVAVLITEGRGAAGILGIPLALRLCNGALVTSDVGAVDWGRFGIHEGLEAGVTGKYALRSVGSLATVDVVDHLEGTGRSVRRAGIGDDRARKYFRRTVLNCSAVARAVSGRGRAGSRNGEGTGRRRRQSGVLRDFAKCLTSGSGGVGDVVSGFELAEVVRAVVEQLDTETYGEESRDGFDYVEGRASHAPYERLVDVDVLPAVED